MVTVLPLANVLKFVRSLSTTVGDPVLKLPLYEFRTRVLPAVVPAIE